MGITQSRPFAWRRIAQAGVVALLAVLASGCYRTTELQITPPAPGTRIVAELSSSGVATMEPLIGERPTGVEGTLYEARPEGWELALIRVDHRGSPGVRWAGERVLFPTEALGTVRERRFDRGMTIAFGAGAGVVLAILARNFMSAWIDGDTGPRDPDPVQ